VTSPRNRELLTVGGLRRIHNLVADDLFNRQANPLLRSATAPRSGRCRPPVHIKKPPQEVTIFSDTRHLLAGGGAFVRK